MLGQPAWQKRTDSNTMAGSLKKPTDATYTELGVPARMKS